MTAVIAESTDAGCLGRGRERSLDFWGDLAATVDRAGGDPARLWVDDSKAIYCNGTGRDRLEATSLAALHAAGNVVPGSLGELFDMLGAGSLGDSEVSPWVDTGPAGDCGLRLAPAPGLESLLARAPLSPRSGSWRLAEVRSVVVGPARFNAGLAAHGLKSEVHYVAFERLLRQIWERSVDRVPTFVTGDKHGGRHYYFQRLVQSFPEAWIDRGLEGPDLSRYTIRLEGRRVELGLMPGADGTDGLVAMASIVSKMVRELWMDVFNEYWSARVPGLRRTAGYSPDALRFRREIESAAAAEQCDATRWWRNK
jgi:hypothetical protein